jgi:hypothetical protein
VLFKILFYLQTIAAPITRFTEMSFKIALFKTLKSDFKWLTTCKNNVDSLEFNNLSDLALKPSEREMPPLTLFLASSFNVELVYIILKGITQFGYIQSN